MTGYSEQSDLNKFNEELEQNNFQGQWKAIKNEGVETELAPYVWKWSEIRDALSKASDVVSLENQPQGARRSIGLRNPAFSSGNRTSWTINVGVQMVQPDEIARAHRHNITAFRFVVEGEEAAYTNVEGEQFPMTAGDLILTPRNTWHDHANDSDDPVIWLDGLDVPLIKSLHTVEFENFASDQQAKLKPRGHSRTRYGLLRPETDESNRTAEAPPYRYPWDETKEVLKTADERGIEFDPFNGTRLQYVNPRTGEGPTLKTLSLYMQLCPEDTETHRHNSTEVYHVVQGTGRTVIDGETFEWTNGDCFIVPPNRWHSHHAQNEETILFCVSDKPVFESFGIHRKETPIENEADEVASNGPVSEEA